MSVVEDRLIERSVCFALYSSMQTTLQLYRDLLAPWGLTYQQLLVLAVVWERGEVTPGELAEVLMLDASSISGLVKRLERDGFLRREHSTSDRRSVRVSATPHANEVRGQLAHIEGCVAEAMQLDHDDARAAVATLRSLRASMRAYDPDAAASAAPARHAASVTAPSPVAASDPA